jgi:hypothetical protein
MLQKPSCRYRTLPYPTPVKVCAFRGNWFTPFTILVLGASYCLTRSPFNVVVGNTLLKTKNMATTAGLTISGLEEVKELESFSGEMEIYDDEYRITLTYSLDSIKVKSVEKLYYLEFRPVSSIDADINIGLILSTILEHLRDKKRWFVEKEPDDDYYEEKYYDERMNKILDK